jgi:hypothetical protein
MTVGHPYLRRGFAAAQEDSRVMNDQERQIITDIFRRLEHVAHQPRDPETERFIAERVRQQPYAPYAMAQALYVQEQALANLNAEVEQLRAEVQQVRRQPQGGGFLSGLFGGGSRASVPPRTGSPWGGRPSPNQQPYGAQPGGMMGGMGGGMAGGPWGGMQPRGGGGFLQSAMATAAGVAGGMMIASALSNAFGGDAAAGGAASLAGSGEGGAGADAAGGDATGGITDSLYQDASAEEPDLGADFGGDGGDGGDWA